MKELKTPAILLLLFLFSVSASGQDMQKDLVLLHGVVMDAASQKYIPNVHYRLNRSTGGVSGPDGKFSLYLDRRDTVLFSYVGYSDFVFMLSDTLKGSSFVAAIFLQSDTTNIGEVIVIPRMADLRSEFRTTNVAEAPELANARNNLEVATYQGLNSSVSLGDPQANYEILKRTQLITAYEKGGIPSDKMLSINPISFIPAAIYLLANGLPQKPEAPRPYISPREMDLMIEQYRKNLGKK